MNEQITIVKQPFGWQTSPLKVKGSRLVWIAPGLEIYVKGEFGRRGYELAANVALNECIGRNIPGTALRLTDNREGLDAVEFCSKCGSVSGNTNVMGYCPECTEKLGL